MGQQRLEKKRNCVCINWKVSYTSGTTKPKRVVCHPRWAIGAPLSNWAVLKSDNREVCTLSFVVPTLTTNVTTKVVKKKCLAKTAQTKQAITITMVTGIWAARGLRRDPGVEHLETGSHFGEMLWGNMRPLNTKMGDPISALLLES